MGGRGLRSAGAERRRRCVLAAELDRLGDIDSRDLGGQGKGEVDPRRDPLYLFPTVSEGTPPITRRDA